MTASLRIAVAEESQVGAARRAAAELARQLGGDEEFAGRCSIVASEAAGNLVRHGGGGEIVLRQLRPAEGEGLDLLALDRGPGMSNLTECLRDGYSTKGTAGQGLGALRRVADLFEITSTVGRGTALWCRLTQRGPEGPPPSLAIGAVNVALAGEEECGDQWEMTERDGVHRIMLADGLGHGPFAAEAGRQAVAVLRRAADFPLAAVMQEADLRLKSTRGAAVSIVEFRPRTAEAFACGVGNVSMVLVEENTHQNMLSQRGTVGGTVRKVQAIPYAWRPGLLLVLHSDGLSTQWNLGDYPGLLSRHPALIAGVLFRDFRRERDDATVVAIRHLPP